MGKASIQFLRESCHPEAWARPEPLNLTGTDIVGRMHRPAQKFISGWRRSRDRVLV